MFGLEGTQTVNRTMQKAEIYKLLSLMYREPREDLAINSQLLYEISKDFDEKLTVICEKMNLLFEDESQDIEEYLVEYSKLFVGPFKLAAPPYASIYLEDKWEVMSKSSEIIESYYQSAGLTIAPLNSEPSDHISLQLEFMYYLNFKWNETGDSTFLILQKEFLYRILTHWIPKFNVAIQQGATLKFYQLLGDFTGHFIQQDFASQK